jgi:subtilisin family serine protease
MGRRLVRKCATRIVTDHDTTDFIIFEGDSNCFSILKGNSAVISVEEDRPVYAFSDFDIPIDDGVNFGEIIPWGFQAVQADQISVGEYNVTVCIVDTGIAIGHPDFDSKRINGMNRSDAKQQWKWDADRSGHGTHVSGVIAALEGNSYGVTGAGVFDLFIVRALDDDGNGFESDIYKALRMCIEAGADVVNLSLGSTQVSDFSRELYREAVEKHNMLLVAAAGNTGDSTKNFPASHPSVISVGAADNNGKKLISSVSNDQVELVAPGFNIISTSTATHAVKTNSFAYNAYRVVGTPNKPVTGPLAISSDVETGGVCMFDLGDIMFSSYTAALETCAAKGGKGAIFYNSSKGPTDIESFYIQNGQIPAVCISKTSAQSLVDQLLDTMGSFKVTIGDEGGDNVEFTFEWMSGTSMAAPHVSASAALLKSHFYNCTASQIRYALALNANHPEDGCNEDYGYGMVQVKDAYDWLVKRGGCSDWDVETVSEGGCTTIT